MEEFEYRVVYKPTEDAEWLQFRSRSGGTSGTYPTHASAQRGARYLAGSDWRSPDFVKIQRRPVNPWEDA